ncbi:MAG: flagellar basal body rod protein FlgB [Gemmatimonadetes bacterium]|nr:flagellar basal body rod protein FlgB [Gemmatimonadota bacterium]
MMDRILFGGQKLNVLKSALDAYADRAKVHAQNVANAETPGYRSQEVRFEEDLRLALRTSGDHQMMTTNPRHVGAGANLPSGTRMTRNPISELNGNGINDVDIDREMADIADNTLRFTVAADLVSRAYSGMRNAIRGRVIG